MGRTVILGKVARSKVPGGMSASALWAQGREDPLDLSSGEGAAVPGALEEPGLGLRPAASLISPAGEAGPLFSGAAQGSARSGDQTW